MVGQRAKNRPIWSHWQVALKELNHNTDEYVAKYFRYSLRPIYIPALRYRYFTRIMWLKIVNGWRLLKWSNSIGPTEPMKIETVQKCGLHNFQITFFRGRMNLNWSLTVWPDWAINLPKSPTFLGNFCKGVKSTFFKWNLIWATFINIWRFLSCYTATWQA